MRAFSIISAVALLLAASPQASPQQPPRSSQPSSQQEVDYFRDVKPLLRQHCYACHGALKQEAGLRLDSGESIRRGGDGGAAVVAGRPGTSLLIQRAAAEEAAERMPPDAPPLSAEQIAALRRWIAAGAATPADEQPEADPRQHWAFRPPVRPPPPGTAADSARHPIDRLIQNRREGSGLTPLGPAPRHAQLRRVYLDLIGLPPARRELLDFLADDSPDAYRRVVDRLLNSPQYGERWARHWMDVWRYADWHGRRHVPDVWNSAPQVWRWRDWIVRSLNDDKGYDQMLREMLAADEVRPADPEAAVATGYLIRNWYALNPNDWMRNTVEHTGKAFLGLTFNCAHCHDHKYDPIAQADYFRLRAFFEPMYVRQDRVAGEADPGPFEDYSYGKLRKIQRLGLVRVFDKSPDAPTWFYTGGDERNRVTERGSIAPGVPAFLDSPALAVEPVRLPPRGWYPGLQPGIQRTALDESRGAVLAAESALSQQRDEAAAATSAAATSAAATDLQPPIEEAGLEAPLPLRAAEARLAAARAELRSVQARIAADRARYGETPGADAEELAAEAGRAERLAGLRAAEAGRLQQQLALAAAEAKPESDEKRAAEVAAAAKALAAAEAAVAKAETELAGSNAAEYSAFSPVYPRTSTGRRRGLARWIASRDNPLTARVAVNHIWMRHFHQPLVASVYDFGRNGAAPTHPQLLDWLAVELMDSGWSMKHLHRLIVTSDAYRRTTSSSSRGAEGNLQVDPENKLLWRMNAGRMEAELVRDGLLHCGGMLDLAMGGQPLENTVALTTFRRSLYYEFYPEDGGASRLAALFDPPSPLACYRRTRSVVPQQALALTNSRLVHDVSKAVVADWRARVEREQPPGSAAAREGNAERRFIADMFRRILSRTPTPAELTVCREGLARQRAILSDGDGSNAADAGDAEPRVLESLVRTLLNHNDFITIR